MSARVFSLVAPFTSKLAAAWTPLPMLTLGVPSLAAAALALSLAETRRRNLPTAMEDIKDLQVVQILATLDKPFS